MTRSRSTVYLTHPHGHSVTTVLMRWCASRDRKGLVYNMFALISDRTKNNTVLDVQGFAVSLLTYARSSHKV